jgi:hypothetical protein
MVLPHRTTGLAVHCGQPSTQRIATRHSQPNKKAPACAGATQLRKRSSPSGNPRQGFVPVMLSRRSKVIVTRTWPELWTT